MHPSRSLPLWLGAIQLLVACTAEQPQVSREGRLLCLQRHPAVSLSDRQQERTRLLEHCLRTVDAERRQSGPANQGATTSQPPAQQPLATPTEAERLFFCQAHQSEIRRAEQELTRTLAGRIRSYKDSSLSPLEKQQLIDAYQEAERELARLIPERFRQGLSVVDAGRLYSRCDSPKP